jgi:putative membrane protein insertion efficiency factor
LRISVPAPNTLSRKTAHAKPQAAVARNDRSTLVASLLVAAIRFYQAVFAPLMPVGCKFYPSCSRYAAEAITRHGAKRGLRLALGRLWRCRPFTKGGVDLVPDIDEERDGAESEMSEVRL